MPSFLNPLILLGLMGAVIPLLIHLFTRRKLKKVEFSSLQFLKDLEKTKIRQVKLKNLILLLLRTLIIILIVLAFARPALKGELAGLGRAAASSAVILLDDSYSMGTQTSSGNLFEIAQKKCLEVLNQLSSQDECAMIYSSAPPDSISFTRDLGALKDSLSRHKSSFANTKFGRSLELVHQLLKNSSNLNRELYVFTNKNGSGWEKLASLKTRVTIYWVWLSGAEPQNLVISEIDFGQQLIELGRPFSLRAEIKNYGRHPAGEHLAGFYMDGKKVAQSEVKIEAGSKTPVEFSYSVGQPGFHRGHFDLSEDDLLADNFRYFAFKIPDRIRVLLIGEVSANNQLISLALKPEEKLNLNLAVTSGDKSALESEEFKKYDVIILNDLKRLSGTSLTKLAGYLESGGGVWLILGKEAQKNYYSPEVTPKFFGTNLKSGDASMDKAGFYHLERLDLNHPIFAPYREIKEKDLPELKFYRIHSADARPKGKILAYFSGDHPALIENQIEKGKALLFLAGLDTLSSDISRHPFFVPWVNRMVGYLAQDLEAAGHSYAIGEVAQRELTEVPGGQALDIVYPDQTKESVKPLFTGTSALIRVANTALPGIYLIKAGERVLDAFAVNLDARESEPEKIELGRIRKTLEVQKGQVKLVEVPVDSDVGKFIHKTRYGRELWRESLILALLLLGAEMWLGRTGSKVQAG